MPSIEMILVYHKSKKRRDPGGEYIVRSEKGEFFEKNF